MVNKTLISTKKHVDREFVAKTSFETTSVDIETPQTMILLLASKEEMVILKALASLDKFAGKLEQNAKILFEEEILKPLNLLLDHTNIYIKRFATKLLAELCFLQPVVETLLQDFEGFFLNIITILHEVSDFVVKEFSASIIAELTKTKTGYDQLLETNMIHTLIPLLLLNDPDIQYNTLKIMLNMIQDAYDKTLLTEESSFTIKHFINLLMSEYVAIQNITLDILYILTEKTKQNPIPKQFQDAGGVAKLLAIVKDYEWKDLHRKCLGVLGNIYNDPDIAQNFLKDGVMQLFSYIDFMVDPQLIQSAIEVLAKIAATPLGRKVFADSGYIPQLEAMLQDCNPSVCSAVCHCIANLAQDSKALRQLTDLSTVKDLLNIVTEEQAIWVTRGMAINALYEILKRDSDSCTIVADQFEEGFIELIINEFDENTPLQVAVTAVNCISILGGYSDIKEKIISEDLVSSLLHCFKDFPEDTTVLKLAACEALCSLLSDDRTRDLLYTLDGLSIVWESITKHPNNVQFLQSAASFVHLCITNEQRFTPTLLRLGVLNWLLSQSSLRNECPAWEMALETVFGHFLPIKFAFTGRLEMTDITENQFYITKIPMTRKQLDNNMFPILDKFLTDVCSPLWTVYLANFDEDEKRESTKSSLPRKTTASSLRSSKQISSKSMSTIGSFHRDNFFSVDLHLVKYISSIKKLLHQNGFSSQPSKRNQPVVDEDTVRAKARIIGQFVAKQLSGMEQNEVCTAHMLDLHVNELKMELGDNVIPVGFLRVGLQLERALLFKLLADRTGLPCSLVRGSGPRRRGWVEVCLPHLPPTPRPSFPDGLLRPSHVVDLMQEPGALLQLLSYEANQYCGLM